MWARAVASSREKQAEVVPEERFGMQLSTDYVINCVEKLTTTAAFA